MTMIDDRAGIEDIEQVTVRRKSEIVPRVRQAAARARDERGQDDQLRAGGLREQAVDYLVGGLGRDGTSAFGAVRLADPGEQQTQVVVDFGDGAHGRAWVV